MTLSCFRRNRRGICLILIVIVASISFPITSHAQNLIVVNRDFNSLAQGTAGIIELTGPGIAGASASALQHNYPCFPSANSFQCLVAVPVDAKIGGYPLRIMINPNSPNTTTWVSSIRVTSGQYLTGDPVILPQRLVNLLQPEMEASETTRLLSIYRMITPERYWDGSFMPPVSGEALSTFGSLRAYNDGVVRRHTGTDLIAPAGTPVQASANGRVVYATHLDIHGNIVVIDHGEGVFSSYSHLKEIYVVPGQFVLQGDVVGLSGTTGRSTGPHVHWEVAVDDIWVNPTLFEQLRLSSLPPQDLAHPLNTYSSMSH